MRCPSALLITEEEEEARTFAFPPVLDRDLEALAGRDLGEVVVGTGDGELAGREACVADEAVGK